MESTPKIYKAISSVMGEVGAVEKNKKNSDQNYKYRGIDDVYNALNPVMSKHGVVIIPDITERQELEFATKSGGIWKRVILTVKYTVYCAEDGSSVCTTIIGEGSDNSDKATNKAMSAAMKYLLFQIFCIPTEDLHDDADKQTPPDQSQPSRQEPVYSCEECGTVFEPCTIKGQQCSSKEAYELAIRMRKRPICKICFDKEENQAETTGAAEPEHPGGGANSIITTSQARLLFANADKDTVRRVILEFGYESTKAIRKADFDGILKRLADIKLGEADTVEAAVAEGGEEPFDDQLPFAADDTPAA